MRKISLTVAVGLAAAGLIAAIQVPAGEAEASWTQWGGPSQEFRARSSNLAASWPEEGPRKLWSRELGEGYSAILVEDHRITYPCIADRLDPGDDISDLTSAQTLSLFHIDLEDADFLHLMCRSERHQSDRITRLDRPIYYTAADDCSTKRVVLCVEYQGTKR